MSAVWAKSRQVSAAAEAFVRQHLRGAPYVALHVRPYPDECLAYWKVGARSACMLAARGKTSVQCKRSVTCVRLHVQQPCAQVRISGTAQ